MTGGPDTSALLESLLRSSPFDADEAEAIDRVRRLLSEPSPYARTNFEPGHITGSAFVIHPDRRSVALILHSKLQRWLQPGGHVEPGDASVEAGAVREVLEEIGVEPADRPWLLDVDIHPYPPRGDEPGHLHHDIRVAFHAADDRLTVGDGADAVSWWTLEDCLDLGPSIARPAAKLLKGHADRASL